MTITYRTSKEVSARAILSLFRRNEWREWFTPRDTEDLLRYALYVASAWHGRRAVGIATLYGDGRFYARLDTLLVDESYRRQGIGTHLVGLVVGVIDELGPHYCEHDTHEEWLVHFYERFGFELEKGPLLLLLEYRSNSDRLTAYVQKRRAQLKRKRKV